MEGNNAVELGERLFLPQEVASCLAKKTIIFVFSVEHVIHVAELDETRDLKLAPDLKLSDVQTVTSSR